MARSKRAAQAGRQRAVIFDFDGTLADSFQYVFAFLQAEAGNTRTYTKAELQALRAMSMKRLAVHLGVRPWRLPGVYFKGRRVMRAHMEAVQLFPGVAEVLRQLHAEGYWLFVASSNSTRNIRQALKRQGVLPYFKTIRGNAGFTGKAVLLRQLMLRYRLPKGAWYVGDETADIVAAARVGMRSLAVSWGFADPTHLQAVGPDAFARQPADIPKLVEAVWKK